MKPAGIVITVIAAILALGCGFGAATVAANLTQPSVSGSHVIVHFKVEKGDTTAAVANRLQQAGLIRNALLFRAYARYKKLDTGIEQGVYDLSPSMTMDDIIVKLQRGTPDQLEVTIQDGWRVRQYPSVLAALPNFNKDNFLKIVQSGNLNDGTALSKKYWYVLPKGKDVADALEGYLYPDTYDFDTSATEEDVVTRLLDTLGEKLCPATDGPPTQYIHDQAQCKAHAATITSGGKQVNIFTAMESAYSTNNDAQALYDALTIASLTAREIRHYSDAPGVANSYYSRYLVSQNKLPSPPGDYVGLLGSDPSAQYARDTDHPPADGVSWWKDLGAAGKDVDPGNPYNTESTNPPHPGLPPGPIAAPLWDEIVAGASPQKTDNFYFYSDDCGNIHYFKTQGDQQAAIPGLNNVKCS